MSGRKKLLIILGAVIGVGAVVLGIALWATGPSRTLDTFTAALEAKNMDAAMALVASDISAERRENIEFWVEDWVSYEDAPSVVFESDEAWFERVKTDEQGNVLLNKNGDRDKEIKPTPRYWAHLYSAYVTVHFDATDDYEEWDDPMIITLRRKSDATWGMFGNIFRGWEVSRIRYQELDDAELDALFEDFEFGDEDEEELEFELDENGELILDEAGEVTEDAEATDETADDTTATDETVDEGDTSSEDSASDDGTTEEPADSTDTSDSDTEDTATE